MIEDKQGYNTIPAYKKFQVDFYKGRLSYTLKNIEPLCHWKGARMAFQMGGKRTEPKGRIADRPEREQTGAKSLGPKLDFNRPVVG